MGTPLLGKVLAKSLAERERGFRRAFKQCRREGSEPSVHALRVAVRRLIATLEVLGAVLAVEEVREARRNLKKLLRALSPLRDAHIRLLYFEELLPQFRILEKPFRAAARREQKLVKEVNQMLHKTKLGGLHRLLSRVSTELRQKMRDPAIQAEHRSALTAEVREAWRLVEHRREQVKGSDVATIHRVRLGLKRYRYKVEALQSLLPRVTSRMLDRLRDFQTCLGNIQDLEVVAKNLRDYAVPRKPKVGRALAPVLKELRREHGALIRAFLRDLNRLDEFRLSFNHLSAGRNR